MAHDVPAENASGMSLRKPSRHGKAGANIRPWRSQGAATAPAGGFGRPPSTPHPTDDDLGSTRNHERRRLRTRGARRAFSNEPIIDHRMPTTTLDSMKNRRTRGMMRPFRIRSPRRAVNASGRRSRVGDRTRPPAASVTAVVSHSRRPLSSFLPESGTGRSVYSSLIRMFRKWTGAPSDWKPIGPSWTL